VIGCVVTDDPTALPTSSPFVLMPFPELDPRQGLSKGRPALVQVTRYHVRLEDAKTYPFVCILSVARRCPLTFQTSSNTGILKEYDILSVLPTSEKALQLACTELSNPGPNQISIITLPLHERSFHFRLNRKQIKQALRNGVVVS
jgi:ribonuclease P/MRP protein subunit RPP1